MFFDSFGTFDLLMRLARNEEPAPNVPPPDTALLLPTGQLAVDKFELFAPICCAFSPVEIRLQLFAAAVAAAADDEDDDAPLPSLTCWAPMLDDGFLFVNSMRESNQKEKETNFANRFFSTFY